jgi:hypothetical protein
LRKIDYFLNEIRFIQLNFKRAYFLPFIQFLNFASAIKFEPFIKFRPLLVPTQATVPTVSTGLQAFLTTSAVTPSTASSEMRRCGWEIQASSSLRLKALMNKLYFSYFFPVFLQN